MAAYEIIYKGKWPVRDRDAESVGMVVTRDGEYFQFAKAVVSGISLITEHGGASKRPEFWSAAATASVPEIKTAVQNGALPLEDPAQPYEVIPPSPLPLSGPILEVDDVVAAFTL